MGVSHRCYSRQGRLGPAVFEKARTLRRVNPSGSWEHRLRPWGDCRIIRQLVGGNRNGSLLVECDGEKLVAKRGPRSSEAINWLGAVQGVARRMGFVVPGFVPSRSGELLAGGLTLPSWMRCHSRAWTAA